MAVELVVVPEVLVPNPAEVQDYLAAHPDMVELVERVSAAVARRFAGRAQVSLELYRDPEIDDEYVTLCVRQDPYDEDIMDQIDEAAGDYPAELAELSGWFLVTTDFEPPQ
jgi:hypothetical protein